MAIILRPVFLILLTQGSSLRSFEIVHSSASKEVNAFHGLVTGTDHCPELLGGGHRGAGVRGGQQLGVL